LYACINNPICASLPLRRILHLCPHCMPRQQSQ
jgi:hypothetical protein